jgi:L-fucose isomerase-like protein
MDYQAIIAGTVGKQNTFGTMTGRLKPGPMTFARVTTCDEDGIIAAYVGEGLFTNDPVETFGGYGVAHIPDLQSLLEYICQGGFEHHTAMSYSESARAVNEAFENYLGWDVYYHQG